jgi:hypothetical protein
MDTVVDVGSPNVLKVSRIMTLAIITARNMSISSGIKNNLGWKMPFLATSIIPLEKVTPTSIPRLATAIIMWRGATLEPIDDWRKLTASLLTPTIRLRIVRRERMINAKTYNSIL